jgi:hypothetical protein
MAKISLPTAISGYNLQVINDNFDAVEAEFQNKVLYRDNPTGEPNQMENNLDMNSNNILNTRQIDTQLLKLNGVFVSLDNPAVVAAALNTFEYTATASQTTFSVSPFTPALASIQVIVDGLQLPLSDISVSGTSIITPAQLAGAEVMVRMYTQQPTVGVDASVVTYVPEGAGAETTTVQTKLRESVSVKDFGAVGDGVTDDTTKVQAAVTACVGTGDDLYWPDGTYTTTASISNLHLVRHRGPGAIQRGSDMFYVEPKENQSNVLYVGTGGVDTNDGLSASQPSLTIQKSFDVLAKYRPLNGAWAVDIAAGTYSEAVTLPSYLNANDDYLEIRGPSQATVQTVPTVIISYPGSGLIGMDLNLGNKVKVKDIKFANWQGSAITGLNIDDHGVLWAYNVHTIACRQGIVGNGSRLYVQGGIISGYPTTDADATLSGLTKWTTQAFPSGGGAAGVVNYSGGVATIGYGGVSLATGTIIESMTQAGYEGKSFTHCVAGFTTFRSNELAVWVYSNARFDERGNDYKKNQLVHKLQKGFLSQDLSSPSNYRFAETYTQPPTSVGDGNSEFFRFLQQSSEDSTLFGATPLGSLDICHQRQSTTQTGTIAATLTRNLATIKAGMLTASPAGKYVEVFLCGATTGSAGTKTIELRMGATSLVTFTVATGTQTWTARIEIWPNNSTSQIVIATGTVAVPVTIRATRATTMTSDQTLDVWQTIPGAADTALLHEARVVFWG